MATSGLRYKIEDEQLLMSELWDPQLKDNLADWVMFAYPWGKPGTLLEGHQGPRHWQRDDLQELTDHIKTNLEKVRLGQAPVLWRKGTASGRGSGKSALVSWFTDWMMSTRVGSTTIVTANTEPQLKSRTFAEISKWTNMLINSHWFETSVLAVRPAAWFARGVSEQLHIDTGYYYAQGQLWSEENPDAFAGVHNPLGCQVIMDEASGIPNQIFTVTSGFFTEIVPDRYWHVYSNARRNSGGFFDIFHDPTSPWKKRQLDVRTVEGIDPTFAEDLIRKFGVDSDPVRIEVMGQFPKQGNRQFIDNALVFAAQQRPVVPDAGAALVMGVDLARFGNASSVIRFRRGRDARSIAPIQWSNRDTMYSVNAVATAIDRYKPDAVCIDAGNGSGVIDRLRELGYRVNEVWFGSKAAQPEWENKRTEMWADLRDWLGGGCIDLLPQLFTDLTAPEYDFFGKAKDKIMLESKESLVDRGFDSPDHGDALALTFATRVSRLDLKTSRLRPSQRVARDVDYPIFQY
ncbi:MAG: hypothetical protein ACREVZ_12960 [Burkholderiales bacterium]